MSKIDRLKKKKDIRDAYKDLRKKANKKGEAERMEAAMDKKASSENQKND